MTLVSTPFSLIPLALTAHLPVSPDHGSLETMAQITRATASPSVPPFPEVPRTPVLPRVLSLGRQEDQGLTGKSRLVLSSVPEQAASPC